jgi:hypothetical protein
MNSSGMAGPGCAGKFFGPPMTRRVVYAKVVPHRQEQGLTIAIRHIHDTATFLTYRDSPVNDRMRGACLSSTLVHDSRDCD